MPVLQACHRCGRPSDGRYCLRADCQAAKRAVRAHLNRPGRGTKADSNLTAAVVERDQGICWICGGPGATEKDHVVPFSLGGPTTMANLRAAHRSCNARRGAG